MKTEAPKRFKFGIRAKLVITVLVVGTVLLAVSLFVIYDGYKKFVLFEKGNHLDSDAKLISERIESELAQLKNYLSFVASHNETLIDSAERANASYPSFSESERIERIKEIDASWNGPEGEKLRKSLLSNEAANILKDLVSMSSFPILEVFLTDRLGSEVAATHKTTDYYHGDEQWWQEAIAAKKGATCFVGLEYDESIAMDSIVFSCPVIGAEGDALGALRAEIDKDASLKSIFNIFVGEAGIYGIMNSRGGDIFHLSSGAPEDMRVLRNLYDFIVLHKGKGSKLIKGPDGRYFLAGFWKVSRGVFNQQENYVYCLRDLSEALPALKKIVFKLFLLSVILILSLYFLVFLISRKFVQPLDALKREFDYLKKGLFDRRLSIASGDELEELADDFNLMVDDLQKSTISKDYFNQIIQHMSDILFVVDSFGAIDLVNKRACEVLGYTEEELKGKEAIQIFSKKDRFVLGWGLKGLIEEGSLKDKKINLMTKSGKEVEAYLGTRSLRDRDNKLIGLVCLAKDLTQVNKLMDDLKKSTDEALKHKEEVENSLVQLTEARDVMLSILEDTDESKRALEDTLKKLKTAQDELVQAEKMISLGQIAAGVAHEINNPLFVISGEAEMLNMEDGITPSVKASITVIQEQVKRIDDIIKRLLEFSRKKESKFTSLDVNDLLEKAIELLQYQTKLLKRVNIVKKLPGEPLMINGDQNQLQEVFLNMMINAVEAMEDKGGTLTVSAFSETIKKESGKKESKFKAQEKVVTVQFSDTGIGMDEETRKRIFDPFFTTKKAGIGLGLSVCFGIIESHDGVIEVESQPGQGATFTIKLKAFK